MKRLTKNKMFFRFDHSNICIILLHIRYKYKYELFITILYTFGLEALKGLCPEMCLVNFCCFLFDEKNKPKVLPCSFEIIY